MPVREVVFARFDPDVATVLFIFDSGEASYKTPDPFGTDTTLTELATERAEEVCTSFEVPRESDTTVHEVGHAARTVATHATRDGVDHVVAGSTAVRASRVSCSGVSRKK